VLASDVLENARTPAVRNALRRRLRHIGNFLIMMSPIALCLR